jgi:thioredoxin reductase (NADPH)
MKVDKELIIIGAGAAGLTAAQYGARANLDVLLIEEMASGGQALIIDRLENYPGFPDAVSGVDFSMMLEQQARNFGAEILSTTAQQITKEKNIFTVETNKGSFSCYTVILATGAKHRHLGVPGEEEFSGRGVSYCATCDGPFFRDKRMLVVGGGDAACDESMFLTKLTDKVTVVHRRDRFRAQKALAERVLANPNSTVRFNTVLKEIKGDQRVTSVVLESTEDGTRVEEQMDAVFIFIGSDPQTGLVPDLEKDEAGYVVTDQNMATAVPGLYVVGDVRATPFRQIVVAAGEGAVASHSASRYIDEIKGQAYE